MIPSVYVSRYSRLHYAATNKTACEYKDPMRIYNFMASINSTNIADEIAKWMCYAPRTLQDAFERPLTLGTGLQLAEGMQLGRSPQLMQVSTDISCHQEGLKGCVHEVNVSDSRAGSNACWKCGGLGHFQKDCKTTLTFKLVAEMT